MQNKESINKVRNVIDEMTNKNIENKSKKKKKN